VARRPIFLERRSYRQRRMMDAVRLLPILGLVLWMVPLIWPRPDAGGDGGVAMSTALRYLFGVWALLVALSWALWRRTRGGADPGEAPGRDA
jgi:hypothetical protein